MKHFIKIALLPISLVGSCISYANQISVDFLINELKIAHSEYLNGSIDSGLYALESLARLLESDKSATLMAETGPNNLAFTYIRIGLLHERAGNKRDADTYFNKALSLYQGERTDITQLKEAVVKLDLVPLSLSGSPLGQGS